MENNCAKKCIGKWIVAAVPVFIFIFAADYLIHGIWLKPLYEQTASLWRTETEMQQYFPYCILFHILEAMLITALFKKCGQNSQSCGMEEGVEKPCPVKGGLCFGVVIGVFLGILQASSYIYMPIPGELAAKWFLSGFLNGVGSGLILAFVFGRCKAK